MEMSRAIEMLVEAALTTEGSEARNEQIKEIALKLTDRSEGGDSLLAFYALVGALNRLGNELRQMRMVETAKRQAAE